MSDFASYSSSSSSVNTATTSQFRAKVNQMKAWRPAHPPSNRDRLELYALHKQAVSSDIPSHMLHSLSTNNNNTMISIPEKAKMNAWRSKKGIPRSQAMQLYIQECDRQWRVYGNAPSLNNVAHSGFSGVAAVAAVVPPPSASNTSTSEITKSTISSPAPGTPNNTPSNNKNGKPTDKNGNNSKSNNSHDPFGNGNNGTNTTNPNNNGTSNTHTNTNNSTHNVLLTPRGLAAVPLLSAAAAEPRHAYLTRLANTPVHQGWWAKQEPLCADPGTLLAFPETFVLYVASKVEWFSLKLMGYSQGHRSRRDSHGSSSTSSSNSTNEGSQRTGDAGNLASSSQGMLLFSPTVLQSFLWPLHNVLLSIWIVIIFLSTILSTALLSFRAIFLGSTLVYSPQAQNHSHYHPSLNNGNTIQMSLSTIFTKEILPASKAATSLCEYYQAVSIRITGLLFMPYASISQMSAYIAGDGIDDSGANSSASSGDGGSGGGMGIWVAAVFYCTCLGCTWWYWAFVVPWCAFAGVMVSLSCGWCFALIDMAGISQD